ncbi:MAG: hypothetical protein AB7O28_02020 [Vicinamibacterales bacterium]
MRPRLSRILWALLILAFPSPMFAQEATPTGACAVLLPIGELTSTLGRADLKPEASNETADGWSCSWTGTPYRTVVRLQVVKGAPDVSAFCREAEELSARLKGEPLPDVGREAVVLGIGDTTIVKLRRDDSTMTLYVTGATRPQVVRLARTVAAASFTAAAAAPPPPVKTLVDPGASCVALLTPADVTAVLGPGYRLESAEGAGAGPSACNWQSPAGDIGVLSVSVTALTESRASGPADNPAYALERAKQDGQAVERIPGPGEQAVLFGDRVRMGLVKRRTDLVVLSCSTCTAAQARALLKAAVR